MRQYQEPQTREEMIEYMKPERLATDLQWKVIKYGGGLAIAAGLALGAYEAVQNIEQDVPPCDAVTNVHGVIECE